MSGSFPARAASSRHEHVNVNPNLPTQPKPERLLRYLAFFIGFCIVLSGGKLGVQQPF